MSAQIQFTPEDIRREQEKLLQRMAELGWLTGFGWNDTTRKFAIAWTDEGRKRLAPTRVALDSLGCVKADELCALEGLIHGLFIDPSADFYEHALGFHPIFRSGDTFAIVRRDRVDLALSHAAYEQASPGTCNCYIKLAQGIDTLYAEYQKRNIQILHDLKTESYRMQEFMIADQDGNTLNFGQPV